MPWFVIRVGPEEHPRVLLQLDAYPSRAAAEAAALDDSRLINGPLGPVDEAVPPFVVEATDDRDAITQWQVLLGPRRPRDFRGVPGPIVVPAWGTPVVVPSTRAPAGSFLVLSPEAQAALSRAREEARRLGHNYLGTEHLLLGLASMTEGVVVQALGDVGLDAARVRERLAKMMVPGNQPSTTPELTPQGRRAFELAMREAAQRGAKQLGAEHLLLGLVAAGPGLAVSALVLLGASPEAIRVAIEQRLP
jgi:hypothetical protein